MRRWLARLAFPCFILSFVLVYEALRADGTRAILLYTGGFVLFMAGLVGVRERHRPAPPVDDEENAKTR